MRGQLMLELGVVVDDDGRRGNEGPREFEEGANSITVLRVV